MESKSTSKGPEQGSSVSQLREQTETVRDDIRKLGHLAKEAAQEKMRDARDTAAGYVDKGRARASELVEEGRVKANELEDRLVEYVRDQPLKSVLIATGIGVFLGILWSKR